VIDSDELVRVAYTHPAVKRAVAKEFGAEVLDERGNVDRPTLARIVFDKPAKRHFLEQLLHPVVNKARVELMDEAARSEATRAYVWDSPLLMETGLDRLCDVVVFVEASEADRDARTMERGWPAGERERRKKHNCP
jgi:dephospho-CoA kinase